MSEVTDKLIELGCQNLQLREALQAVDDWLNTRGSLKLFQIEKLVAEALEQTKPKEQQT